MNKELAIEYEVFEEEQMMAAEDMTDEYRNKTTR